MSPGLGRGLDFRLEVVMDALGLEEYTAISVPPEMCYRVATVTSAGLQLKAAITVGVRAWLACNYTI